MLRLGIPLAVLASCATEDPAVIGEPWARTTMRQTEGVPWIGEPARRLETGVGALGTRLVMLGGFSAGMTEGLPITTEVLTFDTLAPEPALGWATLPPAPVAWTHANIAAIGGAVYLLGGLDGFSFVAERQVYVLEAPVGGVAPTEWVPIEDAIVPGQSIPAGFERGAAAVVISAGHVFLLGGASTTGTLDSVLDFDVGTRTWSIPTEPDQNGVTLMPKLPTPRSHAAAMRDYDGTFIIAGGLEDNTTTRPLGDVYAFQPDPAVRPDPFAWELRESMPTVRGGCAYGNAFGRLICAGGEAGLDALDVVEIYDPTPTPDFPGGQWTTGPAMPEPRAGARGTVIGDRLYVPGGSATLTFEPTDSLFVFSPGL